MKKQFEISAERKYIYGRDVIGHLAQISSITDGLNVAAYINGTDKQVKDYSTFMHALKDHIALEQIPLLGVCANAQPLTIEKTAGSCIVRCGSKRVVGTSTLLYGLAKQAAPYKMIFKPIAVRFELDAETTNVLKNTIQKQIKPKQIYKVVSTKNNTSHMEILTQESVLSLLGCDVTPEGISICPFERVFIRPLSNGFIVGLNNSEILTFTEVQPMYKKGMEVYVLCPPKDALSTPKVKQVVLRNDAEFDTQLKEFTYIGDDYSKISESSIWHIEIKVDDTSDVTHNHYE
jgi:hypothetical protein